MGEGRRDMGIKKSTSHDQTATAEMNGVSGKIIFMTGLFSS